VGVEGPTGSRGGGITWGVPSGHSPQRWPDPVGGQAPRRQSRASRELGDLARDGESPAVSILAKARPGYCKQVLWA
jgi:hypothetical protein